MKWSLSERGKENRIQAVIFHWLDHWNDIFTSLKQKKTISQAAAADPVLTNMGKLERMTPVIKSTLASCESKDTIQNLTAGLQKH